METAITYVDGLTGLWSGMLALFSVWKWLEGGFECKWNMVYGLWQECQDVLRTSYLHLV